MAAGKMPNKPVNTEGVDSTDIKEKFIGSDTSDTNFASYRVTPAEDMTVWQTAEMWPQPVFGTRSRFSDVLQQFLPFRLHGFEHRANRDWLSASGQKSP
jgi:hypothetical protein